MTKFKEEFYIKINRFEEIVAVTLVLVGPMVMSTKLLIILAIILAIAFTLRRTITKKYY